MTAIPGPLRQLAAGTLALALGGCSVGVGYTYHDEDLHDVHDHHGHQHYEVAFSAVVVGGSQAPTTSIDCLDHEQIELVLSLENQGPQADAYTAVDGRSHRFVIYDDWGEVVWDSWHWHQDSGLVETWALPAGATISLSERWDLSDDHGHALPPGTYTVEAWFSGSLDDGEVPARPPPVVIGILPSGFG